MRRFLIDELRDIERTDSETGSLSALIERLIRSSSTIEAKVYDSDARTGMYVVVLEGLLDQTQ